MFFPIDLCLANDLGPGTDRRLVGGRPENQAKTPELRIKYNANINKYPIGGTIFPAAISAVAPCLLGAYSSNDD
jgi:hypothetical protein